MAAGFYFLIPTLPVFAVDILHAGTGSVGFILAAFTVTALIIRPFAGIAIDTWGRKWIFLASFMVFTATIILYPLTSTFAMLLAVRLFHGLSWGSTTTSGSTLVVDVIPPSIRGKGLGYFGISFTIAMALAPLAALGIQEISGYFMLFVSASLLSLAGLILVLFVRFPVFQPPAKSLPLSWKRFLEPTSIPVSVTYALYGIPYGGLVSFIPLFDKELGLSQSGLFFLLLATGIISTRLFSGRILDRHGPLWLVVAGFCFSVCGYLILGLEKNANGFIIAPLLIGLGAGILMPVMQTMVNNMVDVHRRGAANATFITAFDLGIGLGALVLGYLAEIIGFGPMYLVCVLILIAALMFYLTFVNGFYSRRLKG
jgi:MFS family permease